MTLKSIPNFAGGAGVTQLGAILTEIQGLNISLLAGTTAGTPMTLAALRSEDTILAAFNNNAGTLTDIKSTLSFVNLRATGTVTAASVLAGDTVTVNGRVFTAVGATAVAVGNQFSIGASDTLCATNLAAAINAAEVNDPVTNLSASRVSGVVTITATTEGTAGNSIALATSNNTRLAKSNTTLLGGSATGGLLSTGTTNQVILHWYNKNP